MTLLQRLSIVAGLAIATAGHSLPAQAEPPRDGELREYAGEQVAWDGEQQRWLPPLDFWNSYAARSGGITWGHSTVYPDYDKVKEFDTFLVEARGGPCLMMFFHSRWRRANDVRRWDQDFNQYAGCPNVFE